MARLPLLTSFARVLDKIEINAKNLKIGPQILHGRGRVLGLATLVSNNNLSEFTILFNPVVRSGQHVHFGQMKTVNENKTRLIEPLN